MQKKSISKHSYCLLNSLFHSLCLAGLLWQVTKVSIDFFHYEVMKDINIIMPEEVKNKEKIVFICIDDGIIDMNEYEKILATKDFQRLYNESEVFKDDREINMKLRPSEVVGRAFSAKERIAIFPKILLDKVEPIRSRKFFIGDKNCFQVEDFSFFMKKSNIELFYIYSSRESLPYFYEERLIWVLNLESLQSMDINHYSYSIMRMEKPYQDKCLYYKTTKKSAIAECLHNLFIRNQFYTEYDLIDEKNYVYRNLTYKIVCDADEERCKEKYTQSACNETIYFNQVDNQRKDNQAVYNKTDFFIYAPPDDTSPSFIMESKARINIIDFITYIMGALGSWIGFSFSVINPVPFIFKIKDYSISDSEATSDYDQDEVSSRNKVDSERTKSRIRNVEYKYHTIDQCLGEMRQKMSTLEQTVSAIKQENSIYGQKLDKILREIA